MNTSTPKQDQKRFGMQFQMGYLIIIEMIGRGGLKKNTSTDMALEILNFYKHVSNHP